METAFNNICECCRSIQTGGAGDAKLHALSADLYIIHGRDSALGACGDDVVDIAAL